MKQTHHISRKASAYCMEKEADNIRVAQWLRNHPGEAREVINSLSIGEIAAMIEGGKAANIGLHIQDLAGAQMDCDNSYNPLAAGPTEEELDRIYRARDMALTLK